MTGHSDEYEQTSDSNNAVCPYCGHAYQVEAADYNAMGVEEDCGSCGRTYERHTEFDVTHYCTPKP